MCRRPVLTTGILQQPLDLGSVNDLKRQWTNQANEQTPSDPFDKQVNDFSWDPPAAEQLVITDKLCVEIGKPHMYPPLPVNNHLKAPPPVQARAKTSFIDSPSKLLALPHMDRSNATSPTTSATSSASSLFADDDDEVSSLFADDDEDEDRAQFLSTVEKWIVHIPVRPHNRLCYVGQDCKKHHSSSSSTRFAFLHPRANVTKASTKDAPATVGVLHHVCSICTLGVQNGDSVTWSPNKHCPNLAHSDCLSGWMKFHDNCPCCDLPYLPEHKKHRRSPDDSLFCFYCSDHAQVCFPTVAERSSALFSAKLIEEELLDDNSFGTVTVPVQWTEDELHDCHGPHNGMCGRIFGSVGKKCTYYD